MNFLKNDNNFDIIFYKIKSDNKFSDEFFGAISKFFQKHPRSTPRKVFVNNCWFETIVQKQSTKQELKKTYIYFDIPLYFSNKIAKDKICFVFKSIDRQMEELYEY